MPEADGDATPGRVEATAAAVAGPAFAASLVLLRDVTILPPSLFDAVAAVLAGLGLAQLAHRLRGRAAGTLTRGAGFVAGALLLTPALVPPFDRAVPAIALWVAGGAVLQANARAKRPQRLADALAIGLLASGVAVALFVADAFPEPARLRAAVTGAALAAALGVGARIALLRSRWAALAPAPVGILLVCAFGAIYLAYRGLVDDSVDNLPLYEWTLAVAAAGLVLSRLRRQAHDAAASDAWASEARRHAQDVAPVYDRRMGPLVAAVGRYLDTGMGFDEYRAAIEGAARDDVTPGLRRALDEARIAPEGRGRASRRQAAEARLAAHRAVLHELNAIRGLPHGRSPSRVRAHP